MAGLKGSRSHKHTRLNRYTGDVALRKRRRGFQLWWIIPISGIVAVIFALLLGNCLGSKVGDGAGSSTPVETPSKTPDTSEPSLPEKTDVGNIDAIFAGLEGIVDNTYYEVSKQIPEGTKAVSLSMFYSNGAPFYRSEVANAAGNPSGELTLGNIFKYPEENEIYVSVPFPSSVLSSSDDVLSSVKAAYEIAMIKELCEAGADEVIIRCSAFGGDRTYSIADEDFSTTVCEYLSDLRHKVPDINIGFMISASDANDQSLAVAVDKINGYADFIAVDMTDVSDTEELTETVNSALVRILRYKMRVLIGGADEESLAPIYQVLDTLGITNRQVAIKNN